MEHYLSLAVKSIFVENILLAYFLGMCSFLACSKKIETAVGLGIAVTFVLVVTCPANWFITNFLLAKGALSWGRGRKIYAGLSHRVYPRPQCGGGAGVSDGVD